MGPIVNGGGETDADSQTWAQSAERPPSTGHTEWNKWRKREDAHRQTHTHTDGTDGPIAQFSCSDADLEPATLGIFRFLKLSPGNEKGLIRNLWNLQLRSLCVPMKASHHKTVPISPECCRLTQPFHYASQHNLATFLTSISWSFGLHPLPTETPQSLTSPGFSWLMKHKHLTAHEHQEGKSELWGPGNVKAACAGWGRWPDLEKPNTHGVEGDFFLPWTEWISFNCPLFSVARAGKPYACLFFNFYSHKVVFKVCLANFLLILILAMPKWQIWNEFVLKQKQVFLNLNSWGVKLL